MNELLTIALVAVLVAISLLDMFARWIPNILVMTIVILWIPTILGVDVSDTIHSVSTAAVVLAVGIAVWRLGWLGGGDVKLIAALSLWAGPDLAPGLLLAIGLGGGALAMIFLAARRPMCGPLLAYLQYGVHRFSPSAVRTLAAMAPRRSPAVAGTIPYGVAVAAAGCWLAHRLLIA